jgi:hypothetical protein
MHASTGMRFDAEASPRLALAFDFATGDGDPNDRANQRFDPLFGARRFELGPTGLYGALARSNVCSPGARFELAPHRTLDLMAGYRLAWLTSKRDAWTTAAIRDPDGQSGRFIGHQIEARVRWQPFPKNLGLEIGGALLARGHFATQAPGVTTGDPVYLYTQLTMAI